jgi:hypothetical protein
MGFRSEYQAPLSRALQLIGAEIMNRLLISTLLAAGLAVSALPVLSQQEAAPAAKGRQAGERQADRGQRMEARIEQLKTTLKITDAQLPQWNAFADTLRKQARAGSDRMKQARAEKGAKPAPVSAIEQLERRKAHLAEASAGMDEVLATARPLYAALSPEQKKIADDLMAKRGEHGRGGHRPAKG